MSQCGAAATPTHARPCSAALWALSAVNGRSTRPLGLKALYRCSVPRTSSVSGMYAHSCVRRPSPSHSCSPRVRRRFTAAVCGALSAIHGRSTPRRGLKAPQSYPAHEEWPSIALTVCRTQALAARWAFMLPPRAPAIYGRDCWGACAGHSWPRPLEKATAPTTLAGEPPGLLSSGRNLCTNPNVQQPTTNVQQVMQMPRLKHHMPNRLGSMRAGAERGHFAT